MHQFWIVLPSHLVRDTSERIGFKPTEKQQQIKASLLNLLREGKLMRV